MITKDYSQFRKQLVSLGADLQESAKRIVAGMRDMAYAVTVKNTPAGSYPARSGMQGGTLKRSWERGKTLRVGNGWQSDYHNNVYYAIYVNNGHRQVNRRGETTGYVQGNRMMEQGIDTARRQSGTVTRQEMERVKRKTGF